MQIILIVNNLKDVDVIDLFFELIIIRSLVDEDTNPLQALQLYKMIN